MSEMLIFAKFAKCDLLLRVELLMMSERSEIRIIN